MSVSLEVENITAGYTKNPIITDVSIRSEKGSIAAIIGPNGAGKSTLLKSIFGLLNFMGGAVRLDGREVQGLSPEELVELGMGYVPQNDNVFPSLTIHENLQIGGYVHPHAIRERIDEVYGMFPDLAKASKRQAHTLSGGQRNMLAMGRALMAQPEVLLLDEPTAGLSPGYTKVVWDHIVKIKEMGKAVVVVEQNATTALSQSDWAYLLVAGRNREEGPARELLERPDIGKIFLGRK